MVGGKLPQQLNINDMQNRWASIINPVLSSPIVNGQLLANIDLSIGTNTINHKLGRQLKGWLIVGIDGAAQIYDNQATNQFDELTLSLTSDAAVSCSLWVF